MITGLENLNSSLQKAFLEYIAHYCDLSEDLEIESINDFIYKINDVALYIIDDGDVQRKITTYNSELFEEEFANLTEYQLKYIDRDKWEGDKGISTFTEWLEKQDYIVEDSDYFGHYNFYEIC